MSISTNFEELWAPNEMAKVTFVAQGFGDSDRPFMVHESSILRSTSILVIFSTAVILRFQTFSHGVTQAYIQSKHKITCKIYSR